MFYASTLLLSRAVERISHWAPVLGDDDDCRDGRANVPNCDRGTAAVTTGTMTVVLIAEITGVVPTGTATAAYGTAAVLSVIHNGLCACCAHMI